MKCLKCGLKNVTLVDRGKGQFECPQCSWMHSTLDLMMEESRSREVSVPEPVVAVTSWPTDEEVRAEIARQLGLESYPPSPRLTEPPKLD